MEGEEGFDVLFGSDPLPNMDAEEDTTTVFVPNNGLEVLDAKIDLVVVVVVKLSEFETFDANIDLVVSVLFAANGAKAGDPKIDVDGLVVLADVAITLPNIDEEDCVDVIVPNNGATEVVEGEDTPNNGVALVGLEPNRELLEVVIVLAPNIESVKVETVVVVVPKKFDPPVETTIGLEVSE